MYIAHFFMRSISLVGIFVSTVSSKDPCDDPIQFPSYGLGSRNEECHIPHTGPVQCDKYIPDGWFIAQGSVMLTSCPQRGTCGVAYPVWLNGNLPSVDEGIVNRTVCLKRGSNCCDERWQIQMKNCSSGIVYYLKHTRECSSVYCFKSPQLSCVQPNTDTVTMSRTANISEQDSEGRPSGLLIGLLIGLAVLIAVVTVAMVVIVLKHKRRFWRHRQDVCHNMKIDVDSSETGPQPQNGIAPIHYVL